MTHEKPILGEYKANWPPNSVEDVADHQRLTQQEATTCLIVLGLHYLRQHPQEASQRLIRIAKAIQGSTDDET